ncbi:MAG TPA: hypothetical protein VGN61_00020 [Verrucomicrobiae bacterium]
MKKALTLLQLGAAVSICSLFAAGCAVEASGPGGTVAVSSEPGVVYADTAPPPPLDEVEPVSPGADYVWIGGSWIWGGGRWDWERGRWAMPPHPGAHWVAHHYEYRGGRHTFVRGGWR